MNYNVALAITLVATVIVYTLCAYWLGWARGWEAGRERVYAKTDEDKYLFQTASDWNCRCAVVPKDDPNLDGEATAERMQRIGAEMKKAPPMHNNLGVAGLYVPEEPIIKEEDWPDVDGIREEHETIIKPVGKESGTRIMNKMADRKKKLEPYPDDLKPGEGFIDDA